MDKCCVKEKSTMMLVHDVDKVFRNRVKVKSDAYGIPDSFRPILRMLNFHNGCSQQDICDWTHLKAPTISLTLKNMEYSGLIERKENENDKRHTNIFMTEKGYELDNQIKELFKETEVEFLNNISSNELKQVEDVLKKILLNASGDGGKQ